MPSGIYKRILGIKRKPLSKEHIECDGDYWHNRPGAQEKDAIKTKQLQDKGYKVFRFWEKDIHKNFEKCINQLNIN